jgi:hypothetical protein
MARILLAALLFSLPAFGECLPISEASEHVGQKTCVSGQVLTVSKAEHRSLKLNFCMPNVPCPFVVRVFPIDFNYVGDVQRLVGKQIEINGKIKQSNGQPQMTLKDANQLRGDSAKLLMTPKNYDVERQSLKQFSGKDRHSRKYRKHQRNEGGADFEVQEH